MDAVDDDNDFRESKQNQHNDNDDQHEDVEFCNESPTISVNDISLKHFREMLEEHFNVLFHDNNKVIWPRCLPEKPRNVPP